MSKDYDTWDASLRYEIGDRFYLNGLLHEVISPDKGQYGNGKKKMREQMNALEEELLRLKEENEDLKASNTQLEIKAKAAIMALELIQDLVAGMKK